MKKNYLVIIITLIVIITSYFIVNKNDISLVGVSDYCTTGSIVCRSNYFNTVERGSDGSIITTYNANDGYIGLENSYSGSLYAEVCFDRRENGMEIIVDLCENLSLKTLEKDNEKYYYLGLAKYNNYLRTAYFLYRQNSTTTGTYVYSSPHVLIAYDFSNHSVSKVGNIDTYDLAPSEIFISPRGRSALIVNNSPGSFWKEGNNGVLTGLSSIDIQTGKTERLLSFKINDGKFVFIDWIDDSSFLYKIIYSNGSSKIKRLNI